MKKAIVMSMNRKRDTGFKIFQGPVSRAWPGYTTDMDIPVWCRLQMKLKPRHVRASEFLPFLFGLSTGNITFNVFTDVSMLVLSHD